MKGFGIIFFFVLCVAMATATFKPCGRSSGGSRCNRGYNRGIIGISGGNNKVGGGDFDDDYEPDYEAADYNNGIIGIRGGTNTVNGGGSNNPKNSAFEDYNNGIIGIGGGTNTVNGGGSNNPKDSAFKDPRGNRGIIGISGGRNVVGRG